MRRINFITTSAIIFCVLLNALPISAQIKAPTSPKEIKSNFTIIVDPSVVFGVLKKNDGTFSRLLTRMNNGDADASNAISAQGVYFFDQIREQAKDQLEQGVARSQEANKKRYEELKAKRGTVKNAPIKAPPPANAPVKPIPTRTKATIKYDAVPVEANTHVFRNAAFAQPDGPSIQKTETATGIDIKGSETKTFETAESTVTRSADGSSTLNFDGKQVSTGMSYGEKIEAVSKADGRKIGNETKIEWSAAFDICPDADGVVRGVGRARIYSQTTIRTARDLGALTSDTVVEAKITGYVNDAAQMTHFDIEGTATETMIGYDRALDHGLIEDTNGIEDGKGTANFEIKNTNAPASASSGAPNSGDITFGPSKVWTNDELKPGAGARLSESLNRGMAGIMLQLDPLIRVSIKRWQGGECVEVECVPAKPAVKAGESVDITATASSKMDLSKINGGQNAWGTQSVTPEEQRGEPSAVYTLTAPKAGESAYISVTSTSKRGIGSGVWEYKIPKPKKNPPVKPPVKRPHVDPAWKGTIKAVHTEKETKEGQPSGRMTAELRKKENRWEVTLDVLGTRDTTGGVVNNFHAQTEALYNGSDLNERRYAPGKMGCGTSGIITSPEKRSMEIIEKGDGKQLLLVTITVIGTHGYISFGSPGIQAERTVITKYDTNCASYNAKNSSNHTDPRGVSIGSPSFEVEFQVDRASPDEIQGTKTVINHDGSETVYTWHLTRVK